MCYVRSFGLDTHAGAHARRARAPRPGPLGSRPRSVCSLSFTHFSRASLDSIGSTRCFPRIYLETRYPLART
eukprot:1962228-Pleurochrysis_carterae.AAC.1